jgi:hypothetical protein
MRNGARCLALLTIVLPPLGLGRSGRGPSAGIRRALEDAREIRNDGVSGLDDIKDSGVSGMVSQQYLLSQP